MIHSVLLSSPSSSSMGEASLSMECMASCAEVPRDFYGAGVSEPTSDSTWLLGGVGSSS